MSEPGQTDNSNSADASSGQVSEGPSAVSDPATSLGGADSVPDTPDAVPADDGFTETD